MATKSKKSEKKLSHEIAQLKKERKVISAEIAWRKTVNMEQVKQLQSSYDAGCRRKQVVLNRLQDRLATAEQACKQADSKLGFFSIVSQFVDDDEAKKRKVYNEACANLKAIKTELSAEKRQWECLKASLLECSETITRYSKCSSTDLANKLSVVAEKIQTCKDLLSHYHHNTQSAHSNNKPSQSKQGKSGGAGSGKHSAAELNNKNKSIRAQVDSINKNIKLANQYIKALNSAGTSYERKQVHDQCLDKLGDSQPNRVLSKLENKKNQLQRDLDKINHRAEAEQKAKLYQSSIKELVVDGSNLCYCDTKFIGIEGLRRAAAELVKRYRVIVFFDNSIMHKASMPEKKIKAAFTGKNLDCIVVPKGTDADDAITRYASKKKSSYILSNDRFADYAECDAVRNERLIRCQIIKNQFMIMKQHLFDVLN